jgi:UPF0716 protein FxsA
MLLYLIVALLILPFVDFYLLIQVADAIGLLETVVIVLATGIAGVAIIRREARFVLEKLGSSVTLKEISRNFIEALLLVVAGLMLLTPGLITDFLGVLIAFRPFRSRLTVWLSEKLESDSQFEVRTYSF